MSLCVCVRDREVAASPDVLLLVYRGVHVVTVDIILKSSLLVSLSVGLCLH